MSPGDPASARAEYGLLVPEGPGVYRSSRGTGLMVVESAVLHARLLAQGHDALSDLVIERDADALARWLAAPDAPAS